MNKYSIIKKFQPGTKFRIRSEKISKNSLVFDNFEISKVYEISRIEIGENFVRIWAEGHKIIWLYPHEVEVLK